MLPYRILACTLFSLLAVSGIVAQQASAITKEQFSAKYFEAVESAESRAKRQTVTTRRLRGKDLIGKDEWLIEHDGSYNKRWVHSTHVPKVTRIEMITAGEKVFCKTDDGPWKVSEKLCLLGPAFLQVLGVVSSKYSVGNTVIGSTPATLYQEYVTHKNPFKDDGVLRFMESKYWLNQSGLVLRREVKVGVVSSGEISFEEIHTIEYDPAGLKIDVPIK